jgi:hypothetical protein
VGTISSVLYYGGGLPRAVTLFLIVRFLLAVRPGRDGCSSGSWPAWHSPSRWVQGQRDLSGGRILIRRRVKRSVAVMVVVGAGAVVRMGLAGLAWVISSVSRRPRCRGSCDAAR